jgi:hypothetical protein
MRVRLSQSNRFSALILPGANDRLFGRLLATLLLAGLMAVQPGCGLLRTPQNVVNTVVPRGRDVIPDPLALQIQIERFTDSFTAQTAEALDDYAQKVGTEAARVEALRLKLLSASAVTSIASGPNPNASLLDLVAVATLNRIAVQDRRMKADKPADLDRWLAISQGLEGTAWQLATNVLKLSYVRELRETIDQWSAQNPDARGTYFARPQEFASLAVHKPKVETGLTSVFNMVNLDPTAGLDPTVREITQTRLLAERAMFTLQRMPFLVRLQTELLACQLSDQPQMRLVLTNTTLLAGSADRISRATESASQTAAQLPDRISTERKEILAALDLQEGKLKDLTAQVDHTLQSGEKMSTSLNTTITTLDGLMKRFGVGETNNAQPPNTNAEPFRIQDYGQAAVQLEGMAGKLTELLQTLDRTLGSTNLAKLSEQVAPAVQQAQIGGKQVVDYAFWKGILLAAVALLAAFSYRFLASRLAATKSKPPAP